MHRPTFLVGVLTLVIPTVYLFLSVTYLFAVPLLVGIILISLSFGRPARRSFRYSMIAAIFAWVGPFSLIAYAEKTYYVEMVVPKNYAGILTVVRDSKKGSKREKVGKFYRFDFRNSPTIYLEDPWVLYRWSQTRVVTGDGRVLVDETSPTSGSCILKGLGSVYVSVRIGPGSYTSNSESDGTQYRWDLEPMPNQSRDPKLSSGARPAEQGERLP